jgi:hypothetical protein
MVEALVIMNWMIKVGALSEGYGAEIGSGYSHSDISTVNAMAIINESITTNMQSGLGSRIGSGAYTGVSRLGTIHIINSNVNAIVSSDGHRLVLVQGVPPEV